MRDSRLLRTAFLIALTSTARPATLQAADENPALQAFPLDQPSEHIFHFRQARTGRMTLLFSIEGSTGEPKRQELTHLRLTIEAAVIDHNGRTVCHAVGAPKDGMSTDSWVLRAGHGEAAFWHNGCAEFKLKRSESYTLTVCLRDVDPNTPKIKVTPIFERSDNYLP